MVKNSIIFLVAPLVEALDVVLDGIYIVRLARVLNRFWIEARIIRLMLKDRKTIESTLFCAHI